MKYETDGVPKIPELHPKFYQKLNEENLLVYDPYMAYKKGHVISSTAVGLGVQEHIVLLKTVTKEIEQFWMVILHEHIQPRELLPPQGNEFLAFRAYPKKTEVIRWENKP